MRTFAPWVNVHQRTSTTEEALNKQVDEMTEPVNVSQQWAHEGSSHDGREGVMHVLKCVDSLSSNRPLLNIHPVNTEMNAEPLAWHHSLKGTTSHLVAS